jgi:hypothetical protein
MAEAQREGRVYSENGMTVHEQTLSESTLDSGKKLTVTASVSVPSN